MRGDWTVHWDYSYAFAHRIGVYAVIVSTNSIFRLQPACSFRVQRRSRPALHIYIGSCLLNLQFAQKEGGVDHGNAQGRSAY